MKLGMGGFQCNFYHKVSYFNLTVLVQLLLFRLLKLLLFSDQSMNSLSQVDQKAVKVVKRVFLPSENLLLLFLPLVSFKIQLFDKQV